MIILSDIHANLTALKSIIDDFENKYIVDDIYVLGDIINYGMRPNECIDELKNLKKKYNLKVLLGNHEHAIINKEFDKFSSKRGIKAALITSKMISNENLNWIKENSFDKIIFEYNEKQICMIHGSLRDIFWGRIDENVNTSEYSNFSYVFSGHTHISHYFKRSIKTNDNNFRNIKYITFVNPGSVGQPRNHNSCAQYLYTDLDTETFHFNSVVYDIDMEANLYDKKFDEFYKNRLFLGI